MLQCWANWKPSWAVGKGEKYTKTEKHILENKTKSEKKIYIYINKCATVIKGTIAQCVMLC